MSALTYATKRIRFNKSSPVFGPFDIDRYPFLREPLLALDDIWCQQLVIYKAASCLGTVFSQIAMCYRLDQRPGDMLFVAQSDDDATDWSKTRGQDFLLQIESLADTTSNIKYAITNNLIRWPHQFLIICGPGSNARESKQVRYVHTDEAHLDAFVPGSLAAMDARMGERWDRSALHVSTASDSAVMLENETVKKEIDVKYHEGEQAEWHYGCPHCNRLFWPLWGDFSDAYYNGHQVFQWDRRDELSEQERVNSTFAACPHCDKTIADVPRTRRDMNLIGGYSEMNPDHPRNKRSFRWSRFAPDWIPWANIHQQARHATNMAASGDVGVYADFVKKWLCMTWTGHVPNLADAKVTGDYKLGEAWE